MGANIISYSADITSYTSSKYTIPGDGYIVYSGGGTVNTGVVLRVYGPSDNDHYIRLYLITTYVNLGPRVGTFVRKGMRVRVESTTEIGISGGAVWYYQLG